MNKAKRNEILTAILRQYGHYAQIDMCMEEMSELTKALLKYRRLSGDEKNAAPGVARREQIREEIADVQIMLDQMRLIYGDTRDYEEKKLLRQVERMKLG